MIALRPSPSDPELQAVTIATLASLPLLTLLLCTPQMVISNCVAAGDAWVNGTMQSTAVAHATMHTACVALAASAFLAGLFVAAADKVPRNPAALALAAVVFCNKVVLVAAVVKFYSRATVAGGELVHGRLHDAVYGGSAALCALYAATALSVLHVVRWIFYAWVALAEFCELVPFAATAIAATTLYVIALTLAGIVIPENGLLMFRNASTALCKTDGVWISARLSIANLCAVRT
nr:hypothetical protein [Samia ricini nucleopolyhedrovirus]